MSRTTLLGKKSRPSRLAGSLDGTPSPLRVIGRSRVSVATAVTVVLFLNLLLLVAIPVLLGARFDTPVFVVIDCDYAQGFHFGRPVPAAEFADALRRAPLELGGRAVRAG